MNATTVCEGMDRLHLGAPCFAQAAAWAVPMSLLALIQISVAVGSWTLWTRRYCVAGKEPRLPVMETLMAVTSLKTLALLVLSALPDRVNAVLFLLGFTLFLLLLGTTTGLQIFIKLSTKVTRAGRLMFALQNKQHGAKHVKRVRINEDLVLTGICRLLEVMTMVLLVLSIDAAVEGSVDRLAPQFGLLVVGLLLSAASSVVQMERVINALKAFAGNANKSGAGERRTRPTMDSVDQFASQASPLSAASKHVNDDDDDDGDQNNSRGRATVDTRTYDVRMRAQIKELRINQLLITLLATPGLVVLVLVTAGVIPIAQPLIIGIELFETMFLLFAFMTFNMRWLLRRTKASASKARGGGGGGGISADDDAETNAVGFLSGNHSLFSAGVVVQRAGENHFSSVPLHDLERELRGGFVVADDGEAVSVVVQKSLFVVQSDVLLARVLPAHVVARIAAAVASATGTAPAPLLSPQSSRAAAASAERGAQAGDELLPLSRASFFIWLLGGVGEAVLIGAVMCDVGPRFVVVFAPVLAAAELFVVTACLSRNVVARLCRTSFVLWRALATVFSMAAFVVALLDERALIIALLVEYNIVVFLSDAFTVPLRPLRVFFVARLLAVSCMIPLLILLDVVPSAALKVIVTSSFDYSILQFVRDTQGALVVILLFEALSLARGAHKRRFLHLDQPVSFVVLTFDEARAAKRQSRARKVLGMKGKFDARASKLEVHSDFFVKQQSFRVPPPPEGFENPADNSKQAPVRVFVNQVELKQTDALALALLGEARGRAVFFWIGQSDWGKTVFGTVVVVLQWLSLLSFPFLGSALPTWLPAIAAVPLLLLPTRSFLSSSWTVLRLLVTRRTFQTTLFFTLVWLVMVSVQTMDVKCVWAACMFVANISEALVDAQLVKSTHRNGAMRFFTKLQLGLEFLVFAVFMMLGYVPNQHEYIAFRPDLVANASSIDPDAPYVVDTFQLLVECVSSFLYLYIYMSLTLCVCVCWRSLSLANAVERFLAVGQLVRKARPNVFHHVRAPIMARYVQDADDVNPVDGEIA